MIQLENPLLNKGRHSVLLACSLVVFVLQLVAVHASAVANQVALGSTFVQPMIRALAEVALFGSTTATYSEAIVRTAALT